MKQLDWHQFGYDTREHEATNGGQWKSIRHLFSIPICNSRGENLGEATIESYSYDLDKATTKLREYAAKGE